MMPVSSVNAGAVQRLTTAEKALEASKVQRPAEETLGRQRKTAMDEYVPEESQEPSGRYWMGKDGNGQPKIYFDGPERAADTPEQPQSTPDARKPDAPEAEEPDPADRGAKGPVKRDDKEEICEGNTDKVDREIEKLKKKQQELKQRLSTETNETKIKDLERQMAQVERELKQKDNDTYRRRHMQITKRS